MASDRARLDELEAKYTEMEEKVTRLSGKVEENRLTFLTQQNTIYTQGRMIQNLQTELRGLHAGNPGAPAGAPVLAQPATAPAPWLAPPAVAPQPAAASDDLPDTQYTYIYKQSRIAKAKFLVADKDAGRAERQKKLDKYELIRSGQPAERCIDGTYLELWEEMQSDGQILCRTVYNCCLFCLSSFFVELLCIMYFQFLFLCVCVCVCFCSRRCHKHCSEGHVESKHHHDRVGWVIFAPMQYCDASGKIWH
jgi:hypothetical protein